MADYVADFSLRESGLWEYFRISECLEDKGIRHCIAGDPIITALGYPLAILSLHMAVADEQVEDALAVILQQGFTTTPGRQCYVDHEATCFPQGWPGYTLVRASAPSEDPFAVQLMLVPASFWHMDVSAASLSANTFLHPGTRCRFPTRLFYLSGTCQTLASSWKCLLGIKPECALFFGQRFLALIDAVVEAELKPGCNRAVYSYFEMQYHYHVHNLSPETLLGLPPEDKFFTDLYNRPLWPSTRSKVCLYRHQIQQGQLTVEEAWNLIPKKALRLEATWKEIRRREREIRERQEHDVQQHDLQQHDAQQQDAKRAD